MGLVDRAKAILLAPKTEWATIDSEPATIGSIYSSYVIPLAAVPAAASFVGMSIIGASFLGTSIRIPIATGIEGAIVRYALTLAGVYIIALVIDALAPTFGGTKNSVQAFKVAAYSSTAAWVAGIFMVIPALGILGILGLYSLYLLYLGLPVLMKAPAEKAMGYTVVVVVTVIIVFVIIGAVTNRIIGYSSYF